MNKEKVAEQALSLPKLGRGNLVAQVFEILKERITSGVLEAGTRLPTHDQLAEEMGVSVTVTRGAIQKLASLGLISVEQGRGTFVSAPNIGKTIQSLTDALSLDPSTIQEVLEMRLNLEISIVRLAAQRVTEEQKEQLERAVEQMDQLIGEGDLDEFAEHDMQFHLLLAEVAQNRILHDIYKFIRASIQKFLSGMNIFPGTPAESNYYHRKICTRVIDNDPDGAEQAMTEHVQKTIEPFVTNVDMDLKILR